MNKHPDHETDSLFAGFKTNLIIAGVFGAVIFSTLLLHDLIVFGHTTQLVMYLVYGSVTFLGVLAVTALPTKIAPYALLALVIGVAFMKMDGHELKDVIVEPEVSALTQPDVTAVQPDAVPPAVVTPEEPLVVEPVPVQPDAVDSVNPEVSVVVEPDTTVVKPEEVPIDDGHEAPLSN